MRKNKTDGALALDVFDDIFNTGPPDADTSGGQIQELPLAELFPPEFHPFQVKDDDAAMRSLVESVKKYGVIVPGLARPRVDGGYELVAGNRRKRACEIAEAPTMPVIVRNMDDDEAAIAMVDSNLEHREKLLFSERAWAYRVKLEALNHQGAKSQNTGKLSVEKLCDQTGESKNQIFRLVRLTELVPDLLDKVDAKKLAFNPAVELSYLTRTEQITVVDCMARYDIKPSVSQAQRIKKSSQGGDLTVQKIEAVLTEPKKLTAGENDSIGQFKRFFPGSYTIEQIEFTIIELLTNWQAQLKK